MEAPDTLLVTLTGRDRPGVTAGLFAALSRFDVAVLDIEQLVVRGRLVLAVLLAVADDDVAPVRRAVREAAAALDLDVESVPGAPESDARRVDRVDVTVMAPRLRPAAVRSLAAVVADHGANIDGIRRIAAYPVTAVVLELSAARDPGLRTELAAAAARVGVDVAVQRAGLGRRGQHLVVMDVDSTLIQDEVIELVAARAGVADRVRSVTESAMRGELDFAESLRARVALLAGLPETVLDDVRTEIRLTPGARTFCRTLKRLGFQVALVSGGFTRVIEPLAAELGVDHLRANTLAVEDGHLTGTVEGEVVDRAGKRRALEELAAECGLPLSRTIAIGDGANDLDMLGAAGLGVAFNAKPVVRAAADTSVTVPYLDSVLYLLGVTREEVEAADAEAGVDTPAPPVR